MLTSYYQQTNRFPLSWGIFLCCHGFWVGYCILLGIVSLSWIMAKPYPWSYEIPVRCQGHGRTQIWRVNSWKGSNIFKLFSYVRSRTNWSTVTSTNNDHPEEFYGKCIRWSSIGFFSVIPIVNGTARHSDYWDSPKRVLRVYFHSSFSNCKGRTKLTIEAEE